MTTPRPEAVSFRYYAQVQYAPRDVDLSVEYIEVDADIDGVPYVTATLYLTHATALQLQYLDPRNSDLFPVMWRIEERSEAGALLGQLPPPEFNPIDGPGWAWMWPDAVDIDEVTGRVTVTLMGGERRLEDKKRIAVAPINTGATSVSDLMLWSLLDVFGSAAIQDNTPFTPIPAGDRRLMQPGESHLDLLQPELDAINARIIDHWGRQWHAMVRGPAGDTIRLATYTQAEGAPANADPCITALNRTLSRDDWADGVLVTYDNTQNGGTVTYQASGTGANTRGLTLTFDRAAPSSGAANAIAARAKRRGNVLQIDARCRLDVVPNRPLIVYARHTIIRGTSIRSVAWRPRDGVMYIRAESEEPIA